MSVKRLRLIASPQRQSGDDPARAALAAAIEALTQAKADLVANETAESRGRILVAEKETELERASANVAASRDAQADAFAEAIAAARPLPASVAVQAAITAETEAQIALEGARTGLSRIQSDRAEKRAAIDAAEQAVSVAVAVVTSPAIAELVARAERNLADLIRDAAVLRYLHHPFGDPSDRGGGLGRPVRLPIELNDRVRGFLNRRPIPLLQYDLSDDVEALVTEWRRARTQLRWAPYTPLPSANEYADAGDEAALSAG
jgi:hypothetical protein